MKARKNFLFVVFLVLLLSLLSCKIKTGEISEKKMRRIGEMIKEFNISDGMKIIVIENPQSNTVTLNMWVNTGSKNEPEEISGVSHFLEHMLFKGTKTRQRGEIDKIIEGIGGLWNGGTAQDFTQYYLTIPADKFDTGLDVMADVMMNSVFDKDELERERLVILEEYRRKQDDPFGFLYEKVFTATYTSGGYERTVLGEPETIKATSQEKMLKYFYSTYIPQNMVFVIVGNVKIDEIKPKIEATFKDFKPSATNITRTSISDNQEFGKSFEIKKQVNDTYFVMVFPGPEVKNPKDVLAMDLLVSILSEGRSSRLYREIKERKQLVSNISGSYPTLKGKSVFVVFATLKAEKVLEVKNAVLEEIKKISEGSISSKEFEKSRKMLKNSFLFGKETNEGKSNTIGYYYTLTGSTEFEKNYLKHLENITVKDVASLASNLTEKNMNVLKILPEEKK